ncbi:hypothetical protein A2153_01930 [Candidatus Gottesmanbacteria bacterium RBG_16_38_7b]|uniref:Nucleotidyl transferase domain-containing protein n=1 Tax=Candidatus Gottesmanbacteria bacterium RBG_16_38_7b TaxID=1798372 RepID=A0A1F5YFT9_9BACT|nr:MAG: hypothetical protein A2153_01930 [Candidatus Gottesmanbacteria bacterium RBG_16_38_7b]
MSELKAILLAAGDSGRLWPIEDKLFINFFNSTLIQHSLNQLIKIGIKNFYLVASYRNVALCNRLKADNSQQNIQVVIQKNKLGMAGAILSVKEEVDNQPILIVGPSDVFEDYLLQQFMTVYRQKPDGIMVGKNLKSYAPLGYLTADHDIVTGIVEKPPPAKLKSNIASLVFDYFRNSRSLIEAIEKCATKDDDLYEKAKDKLISAGQIFKLLSYNGYWGYLKYPWHVLDITSYFLSRIKSKIKKVKIDKSVKIEGEVYLEDNVTILENVKLVGPVYLGSGTLIGQNSLIRESMIGQNCIVGFNCEIARSFVGNNCWFHGNYVGDSVILDNCAFGSGAIVANYRLDGQTVNSVIEGKKINTGRTKLGVVVGSESRIGINTSLMPGIKIGRHSYVGSGMVVSQDLPDNQFMELKNGKVNIVKNRINSGLNNIEVNRLKLKF